MMLTQLFIASMLACQLAVALENGLARTPPMGFLSWVRFRCNTNCKGDPENCISEHLYMKMADLLVSEGYKDVGYEYVNMDDCWLARERDSEGKLQADPERFPSGIKALADYVHSKGLKLGIYEDFGTKTCAGFPGSEFYMERDANTFAEWGVDMLKFDGCNSDVKDMPTALPIMGKYLNQTGRPILFLCQWPLYLEMHGFKPNYTAVRETCNQWRNYNDLEDSWESVLDIINHYGDDKDHSSQFAGPGGWNDPDELAIGDFGLSHYQEKAHFGMWALFSAPLFMSSDLQNMDPKSKALLQNKNIIAINQDPLGNQAVRLYKLPGLISVWMKKLSNPKPGSVAIGILNANSQSTPFNYTTTFKDLGLSNENGYIAREAFENKTMGSFQLTQKFSAIVYPTSVFILIAEPL